jgi:hypothetical protein
MSDLKVKPDIITSIAESLMGQAVILVIMYVQTFIITFISNIMTCLTS